jgi:hypothetical protein
VAEARRGRIKTTPSRHSASSRLTFHGRCCSLKTAPLR